MQFIALIMLFSLATPVVHAAESAKKKTVIKKVVKKKPAPKKPAPKKAEASSDDAIKKGTEAVTSGKNLGQKKNDSCCDLSDAKTQETEDHSPAPSLESFFSKKPAVVNPSSCSKTNSYYNNALKKVPDVIRVPRANYLAQGASIAPVCMFGVMDSFPDSPSMLSNCSSNKGKAKRKGHKPCATSDYFYSIYNSFIDVTDCMDISQKSLLPKLSNESGMHLNTLGPGNDAGVGQLTPVAVADSNGFWSKYVGDVKSSNKASCKRIAPLLANMKATKAGSANNCNLIAPPENPLKNIFYMGILSKRNHAIVDMAFKNNNIENMALKGGLSKSDIPELKEMIALLGYNAGAGSAAVILKNYLSAKLSSKGSSLGKKDFDFSQDTNRVKKLSCKRAVSKIGIKKITFPEYARACQGAGSNGYLSFVYNSKKNIDKKMGNELCTSKSFLRL